MTRPRLRVRLSVLMALQYAFPGALLQLYSLHLRDLGFDELEVGACCATQAVAGVLTSLLIGQAADRWFAPERCLVVLSAGAGVALLVLPQLHDFGSVFAATLVFWMLANPVILLGTTVSLAHLPRPDRQFGSVRLWGTVGWAVPGWLLALATVAGLVDARGHTDNLFRGGSLFAFALAAYAATLPATPPKRVAGRRSAPLAALVLLRGRTFAVQCICTFGMCATWPFSTQATPFLLERLGVPPEWRCPTLSLGQFTEVICLALLPLALVRLRVRGTMLAGLVAWTLALVIQALGQPDWLVILSLGLNGLVVSGFLVGGQVFLNRQVTGDLRTSAQALLTWVNGLGLLVGHLLVGVLRWWSGGALPQVFAVGAAVMAVLCVLFHLGFRADTQAAPLPQPAPPPPDGLPIGRPLRPRPAGAVSG